MRRILVAALLWALGGMAGILVLASLFQLGVLIAARFGPLAVVLYTTAITAGTLGALFATTEDIGNASE